jgi:hypothetical protein
MRRETRNMKRCPPRVWRGGQGCLWVIAVVIKQGEAKLSADEQYTLFLNDTNAEVDLPRLTQGTSAVADT